MDIEYGRELNYRQLLKDPRYAKEWNLYSGNEFDRLAQGKIGRVKSTETIFLINPGDVPADCKNDATYGRFQCSVRPEKKESNRTRLTVVGNIIKYNKEVGTPTA